MAGRGGKRTGAGRKHGPNKATIEKAIIAQRVMNEAAMSGKKLGKEMIEEFAVMFGGLASAVQPVGTGPDGQVTKPDVQRWLGTVEEAAFERYSKLALKAASDLADYQSPKIAPVHVVAAAPEARGPQKKRFSVGIFDGQGRPAPKQITVKPNSSVVSAAKN
jgi:hypothetical protein